MEKVKFKASSSDFNKIPGGPIAYWLNDKFCNLFKNEAVENICSLREGIHTGQNERFLRIWHEVSDNIFVKDAKNEEDIDDKGTWVPYNKGGTWRKWFGNNELVIGFDSKRRDEMSKLSGHVRPSKNLYFLQGGTWSSLSSGSFAVRYYTSGFLFDSKGQVAVGDKFEEFIVQSNTNLIGYLAKSIMPTLDYKCGDVKKLPYLPINISCKDLLWSFVKISKSDWDAFETSWDFTSLPLLSTQYRGETLAQTYSNIRAFWQSQTDEMKRLEEENNRIFIDAYGLSDELAPDVPLKEITINCNPNYRYGDVDNLEGKLLFDTIQEFIHYAVGNMFGRYSLEKDGLILANQGEGLDDFQKQIPQPKFMPDNDNVLPIFGEGFKNWFSDDIATRFNEFLRISFGDDKFTENLAFIENTLSDNKKGKNISEYFQKHFYDYHIKRFKKRPIYWQFESPKGSFKALIYMHRYKPDQVSVILNDYLREFNNKITHEIESNRSILVDGNDAEKIKAQKEIDRLNPILREITDWERDIIFPLAQARIEIDLDDGVKVNYPKFGKALTKIVGLDASE